MKSYFSIKPGATLFLGSSHTLVYHKDSIEIIYRYQSGKNIRLYECKNCVVHLADESKVVVLGLDGHIVAEKNGQLLVCS